MKFFINKRLKKFRSQAKKMNEVDIKNFKKIFFCVYSRFGDGVISFKVIKEFVKNYPQKEYLLLTSPQLYPYAREILNFPIIYANKRNPIQFFNAIYKIKKFAPELGLNPWSHGSDSEFFITYAKNFVFFKDNIENEKTKNLYDRVRQYLKIKRTINKNIKNFNLDNIKNIIITPFSTDITKNLSTENVKYLINYFKDKKIIIATPKSLGYENEFIFKKSKKNSENFIQLVKNSDLIISVDSGPLHIASALNKKIIAIFGPTAPEVILDNNMKIKIVRNKKLNCIFCFVRNCKKPLCIEKLFSKNFLMNEIELNSNCKIILEEKKCPL